MKRYSFDATFSATVHVDATDEVSARRKLAAECSMLEISASADDCRINQICLIDDFGETDLIEVDGEDVDLPAKAAPAMTVKRCPCCDDDDDGEGHTPMTNYYECECGETWSDDWCSGSDDDCPNCARTNEPVRSVDWVDGGPNTVKLTVRYWLWNEPRNLKNHRDRS